MNARDHVSWRAQKLFHRWCRVARYAAAVSPRDALLRFRLEGGYHEAKKAHDDYVHGRFDRMYQRARSTARRRMRAQVETALRRLCQQHPRWGCCRLAAGMRARGYPMDFGTVRKMLRRSPSIGVSPSRTSAS